MCCAKKIKQDTNQNKALLNSVHLNNTGGCRWNRLHRQVHWHQQGHGTLKQKEMSNRIGPVVNQLWNWCTHRADTKKLWSSRTEREANPVVHLRLLKIYTIFLNWSERTDRFFAIFEQLWSLKNLISQGSWKLVMPIFGQPKLYPLWSTI